MRIQRNLALALVFALSIGSSWSAPPKAAVRRSQLRPLTFTNTIAFFREAFGRRPIKVDARIALFAEGEWKNRDIYNHAVIFVENADEDIEITFLMSGDEGMNWVNEFFDSPFFTRHETESLFQFLHGGLGQRRNHIGRFRVELSRWEPHHHEMVVISLTPQRR